MKIIIARTDNIGDVILSLPMASLLKKRFATAEIFFIARDYVKTIVECCTDVDHFISWDALQKLDETAAIESIKALQADIILFAFPNKTLAEFSKKAGIPERFGTSHRLFHWRYCNRRLHFSRSNSKKHEAQLNLELIKPFDIDADLSLKTLSEHIHLKHRPEWKTLTTLWLNPDKFNLIVHVGSNGNGREWPTTHFIELINSLTADRFHILLTGSETEATRFKTLIDACPQATNLMGKTSLNELTALTATADGLLAGSTGPLHMAAAFGIHALGLYPPRKTASPERWQPIGPKAEYLVTDSIADCATECTNEHCQCMRAIAVNQVKERILGWPANQ